MKKKTIIGGKIMRVKQLLECLTFVPWYLFQTKVLHNDVDLDRLYKNGYCSEKQYGLLKGIKI
jgi:hypothetical protein